MSSSSRCDAVSVSSQLDTHIAEVQDGGTLSVNAFEFQNARDHSGLARLAKDLICVPASQAYVEHLFCLWAALFWTTKRCGLGLSRWEFVWNSIRVLRETSLSTVTVFQRLGVNVTDLCRNSIAEQTRYGDWLTAVWCWTKTKMCHELKKIK